MFNSLTESIENVIASLFYTGKHGMAKANATAESRAAARKHRKDAIRQDKKTKKILEDM